MNSKLTITYNALKCWYNTSLALTVLIGFAGGHSALLAWQRDDQWWGVFSFCMFYVFAERLVDVLKRAVSQVPVRLKVEVKDK